MGHYWLLLPQDWEGHRNKQVVLCHIIAADPGKPVWACETSFKLGISPVIGLSPVIFFLSVSLTLSFSSLLSVLLLSYILFFLILNKGIKINSDDT